MNTSRSALLIALVAVAALLLWAWLHYARAATRAAARRRPSWFELALGFVTNFFDTLGIGSFAPTTAAFRLRRLVADEVIPGTLNVGHALPSIAQALIFIAIIKVDPLLLFAMLIAAVAGAWVGSGIVVRLNARAIQLGMGCALLVAAGLFLAVNLGLLPGGGMALGLDGWRFGFAVAANFVFGALMTIGVGNYAPCLIMLSLLGMNPVSAFPIMTGSSAFLMPAASVRFLRSQRYHLPAALGLTLGGIPGVLVAAYIVRSLPLGALRWMVAIAVTYVALSMLRSALAPRNGLSATTGDG
jgi:uncharacterized membrane protein YfcA